MPDSPEPTSPALTKDFYPRAEDIVEKVGVMFGSFYDAQSLADQRAHPHDIPGNWFTGPF
jgi:pyruvate dehydrogenase E1 component beta subunit